MIDAATRRIVRQRAGDRCEYCRVRQLSIPLAAFHIEHIIAIQHGGTDDLSNLCLSCPDCNRRKGPNLSAIDPDSHILVRLFDPRHDNWDDHFSIVYVEIVGLTETGRATSRLLRFNSEKRLILRHELALRREYP